METFVSAREESKSQTLKSWPKIKALRGRIRAVGVGSGNLVFNGAWDMDEDGSATPALNLEKRGIVPKRREEAVLSLADLYLNYRGARRRNPDDWQSRTKVMLKSIKDR